MKCRILISLFLSLLLGMARAQDIHFSQYYSAPHTINPALVGNFNGDYRIGLNYRTQWGSVTIPYQTFDIFGDFAVHNEKLFLNNFSFGFLALRDQAGDGQLSITKLMGSVAYKLPLDVRRDHMLSVGFQGGYVMKTINWSKLYFHNQWNDAGFDTGLPSGENYSTDQLGYPDLEAGLCYTYGASRNFSFYVSQSVYHINTPKESFYSGGTNELGMRPVTAVGVSLKLNNSISVYPSLEYMTQKKASELVAGGMLGYSLYSSDYEWNIFYAGVYTRLGDAIIPVVGWEYNQWRAMLSYDVNVSGLQPYSHSRGALELSLIYTGYLFKLNKSVIDVPCPRF